MNEQIRSLFPVTNNFIYMNHSAVAPLSTRVRDAMTELVADVTENGSASFERWYATQEQARRSAGVLVNAKPHEIAFMRNTSEGIAALANGIDWREGDNCVTCNVEFPSNMYPWLRLEAERGIKVKTAIEREGRIDPEELFALVDERTKVLTLSWVQFSSGFRSDLRRIGRFCRERGVLFVIDAIQGLGGLKLDVERDYVDAFAADAHKYLLGPEGIALLYISDRVIEKIRPVVVGWTSFKNYTDYLDYDLSFREGAARFEYGTLNTVGIYGINAALNLFLEIGTGGIEEYLIGLTDYLVERLASKGYVITSSRRPGEASAMVTCTHPVYKPMELFRLLMSKRIVTAPRVGKLRISPHIYNTRAEVDELISALPEG